MADNGSAVFPFDKTLKALREAIATQSVESILQILVEADLEDSAKLLDRLGSEDRQAVFNLLTPEQTAEVIDHVYYFQGADIVEDLPAKTAAAIVARLDSDERADLLNELDEDHAAAVLAELDRPIAEETRRFMSYPEGTAGAVMYSEYLAFDADMTVEDILTDLRTHRGHYSEYGVQYAYVLDGNDHLLGVLPVRNLLFAARSRKAREVMVQDPITVDVETSTLELDNIFEQHNFLGLPVVDSKGVLLGIVARDAAAEALQEAATEDMLKIQGLMGRDELRSMPMGMRSRRRLSWLSINIVLNLISASIIALHQDTLQAVIALAVFLPIISDMSGCSGNQAVAVSMRELSLELVSPREFLRVFFKESSVGLINGLVLGLLIGMIAWFWKDNLALGAVVGSALALNTVVAVCVGGLVPLLLKAIGQDPALASGPILTTVTDMCGFLLILGIASIFLPFLL